MTQSKIKQSFYDTFDIDSLFLLRVNKCAKTSWKKCFCHIIVSVDLFICSLLLSHQYSPPVHQFLPGYSRWEECSCIPHIFTQAEQSSDNRHRLVENLMFLTNRSTFTWHQNVEYTGLHEIWICIIFIPLKYVKEVLF